MNYIFIRVLLLCSLLPFTATAQIGIADPVTGNALIDFYGRVVDQDGKPLSGAKVDLRVLVGYLASPTELGTRYEKTTLSSSSSGDFILTGAQGHSVEIESIDKDGYELSQTIARLYPYSWTGGVAHPDPKNPVLFVPWEKGKQNSIISADKHFDFIPDGRLYALSFDKHTVVQATNSEGDFQFRLTRPAGVGKSNKFDWSFSLQGQGGNSLQQTAQRYFEMTFSPKEGFTNTYEEVHEAANEGWKRGGRNQFYIKMRDGHSYGKAAIIWDAVAAANGPKTNEAGIRIQYTINPAGAALAQ